MKISNYEKKIKNVKAIKKRHAVPGDIITPCDVYDPMLVLTSYFDPHYIEKYGYDSKELLYNGTNYVDAIRLDGSKLRLQYYEYAILVNSQRIKKKYLKEYPQTKEFIKL